MICRRCRDYKRSIQNGHVVCLRLHLKKLSGNLPASNLINYACFYPNVEIIKVLHNEFGYNLMWYHLYRVILERNFECLKWLVENDCTWENDNACFASIITNNYEFLDQCFIIIF